MRLARKANSILGQGSHQDREPPGDATLLTVDQSWGPHGAPVLTAEDVGGRPFRGTCAGLLCPHCIIKCWTHSHVRAESQRGRSLPEHHNHPGELLKYTHSNPRLETQVQCI